MITHVLRLFETAQCCVLECRYEFSEADAACALQAIDSWLETAAHGAQHISPEKVNWATGRLSFAPPAAVIQRGRMEKLNDTASVTTASAEYYDDSFP